MDLSAIDEELSAFGKSDDDLRAVRERAVAFVASLGPEAEREMIGMSARRPASAVKRSSRPPPPANALADEPMPGAEAAVAIEMSFEDSAVDRQPAPPGSVPPPADHDPPSIDIFAGLGESDPPAAAAPFEAEESTEEHALPGVSDGASASDGASDEDFELLIDEDLEEEPA